MNNDIILLTSIALVAAYFGFRIYRALMASRRVKKSDRVVLENELNKKG